MPSVSQPSWSAWDLSAREAGNADGGEIRCGHWELHRRRGMSCPAPPDRPRGLNGGLPLIALDAAGRRCVVDRLKVLALGPGNQHLVHRAELDASRAHVLTNLGLSYAASVTHFFVRALQDREHLACWRRFPRCKEVLRSTCIDGAGSGSGFGFHSAGCGPPAGNLLEQGHRLVAGARTP